MFKTILACLPSPNTAEAVSLAAAKLAQEHGAFLIGARNTVQIKVYGSIPSDILSRHAERERSQAEQCQAAFHKAANNFGVAHEWRSRPAEDTDAFRDIVAQSRTADLVVAPAKDHQDPFDPWYDLPEHLTMDSGRPLLLIPQKRRRETIGSRIAIAWNGSREAARAAFDALPLLQKAGSVHLLVIANDLTTAQRESASEFSAALARHEVQAELVCIGGNGLSDGEELLAHVDQRDCDMLVMGFYGHSRLREIVFGGATRHILRAMTVPVFASH